MPEDFSELYAWLAKNWLEHFAQVLDAMCDEHPEFMTQPQTLTAEQVSGANEEILWWREEFSITPEASCWIGALGRAWETIGAQVLKAAGIENGEADDIRGTYLEIVNQSLAALAQSVSARVGRELTCAAGTQTAPDSAGFYSLGVSFVLGETECNLVFVLNERFADALRQEAEKKAAPPSQPPPQPAAAPGQGRSIELLLDVELPVSVSFGRAQLPLKDVLKLTTGSIIELNRAVSEPVEVIVNNCVIARGEVVVVEGNFGVRIRQVISPQERIRTLR